MFRNRDYAGILFAVFSRAPSCCLCQNRTPLISEGHGSSLLSVYTHVTHFCHCPAGINWVQPNAEFWTIILIMTRGLPKGSGLSTRPGIRHARSMETVPEQQMLGHDKNQVRLDRAHTDPGKTLVWRVGYSAILIVPVFTAPGYRVHTEILSYQYRDPHYEDKTVLSL